MKRWLAAAAAGVFLVAAEQVQATRLGFELDKTRHLIREAKERQAYLRLDLERRTTPGELAQLARARLGMVPPSPDSVVDLETAKDRPLHAAAPVLADAGSSLLEAPASAGAAGPEAAAAAAARLEGVPSAGAAALRTQLLSWLLPSDSPRWR